MIPQRDPYSLDIGSSYKYNLLALAVSLTKVTATILLFLTAQLSCFSAQEVWMLIILVHDIAYSTVIAKRLKLIKILESLTLPESQQQDMEDQSYDLHEIHSNNQDRTNIRNPLGVPLVITSQRNIDSRIRAQSRLACFSRSLILSDM